MELGLTVLGLDGGVGLQEWLLDRHTGHRTCQSPPSSIARAHCTRWGVNAPRVERVILLSPLQVGSGVGAEALLRLLSRTALIVYRTSRPVRQSAAAAARLGAKRVSCIRRAALRGGDGRL
jgi:hypothetical protein